MSLSPVIPLQAVVFDRDLLSMPFIQYFVLATVSSEVVNTLATSSWNAVVFQSINRSDGTPSTFPLRSSQPSYAIWVGASQDSRSYKLTLHQPTTKPGPKRTVTNPIVKHISERKSNPSSQSDPGPKSFSGQTTQPPKPPTQPPKPTK